MAVGQAERIRIFIGQPRHKPWAGAVQGRSGAAAGRNGGRYRNGGAAAGLALRHPEAEQADVAATSEAFVRHTEISAASDCTWGHCVK